MCTLCLACSPSSASADDVDDDAAHAVLRVDDLSPDQFAALAALSPVFLGSNSASSSGGNITNDVAALLAIMQAVTLSLSGVSNIRSFPVYEVGGSYKSLGYALALATLENPSSMSSSGSFLYEIQRALYGQAGVPSSGNAIQPLLSSLNGDVASIWGGVNGLSTDSALLVNYADGMYHDLDDLQAAYAFNPHFGETAWTVGLLDVQMDSLLDAIGHMQDATADVAYGVEGLTDSTSNLLSSSGLSAGTSAAQYVDDGTTPTGALDRLTIDSRSVSNMDSMLGVVDPDDVGDVLPSLTGGSPLLEVYPGGTIGPVQVPRVVADLTLPVAVASALHGAAVWLWRILFAVGLWRILATEYAYWSTLGGSAPA